MIQVETVRLPDIDTFRCAVQAHFSSHKLAYHDETTAPLIANSNCQELPEGSVGFCAWSPSLQGACFDLLAGSGIAKVKTKFLS